jgi:predicted CopG family antitoxin
MKTKYSTIRISRVLLTKLRNMKKGAESYDTLIARTMLKKTPRKGASLQ